jgi:hypothetical protein
LHILASAVSFPLERFVMLRTRPGLWQDLAITFTRIGGAV